MNSSNFLSRSRAVLGAGLAAVLASVSLAAPPKLSPAAEQFALQQLSEISELKRHFNAAQQKLDSALFMRMRQAQGKRLTKSIDHLETGIEVDARGMVRVRLQGKVDATLINRVQLLGGQITETYPQFNSLYATVPILQVERVAGIPSVQLVSKVQKPFTRTISKGDTTHAANTLRSTYGLSGQGVKVGVLSDSVKYLTDSVNAGELPNNVQVLPGMEGPAAGHGEGTAMLEIVHDLAPNASLAFATAFLSPESFAQNILDLKTAGCNVIVDDVGYLNEPAFQDGIIAQAVQTVTNAGALYFSSAGNEGRKTANTSGMWEGDFVDSGQVLSNGEKIHSFGSTTQNTVLTAGIANTLMWSDPQGASNNDYDLYVYNSNGTLKFSSFDTQNGTQNPYEDTFSAANTFVIIAQYSPSNSVAQPRYLRLNAERGTLGVSTAGQTFGHNSAPNAFGMAATDANGPYPSTFSAGSPIESFSSDGPRRVFFNADGSAITPGNFLATGGTVRQKPEFAAADGVATSVPGFNPFYGTSAAAPHAAAIAALLLQANPNLDTAAMRTVLAATAWDTLTAGWDRDSGAGIINALLASKKVIGESPTITFSPATVVGGTSATGTITLAKTLPVGVTYTLTSGSATVAVPATITIPANTLSRTFTATTSATAVTVNATVSAKLQGTAYGKTGTLTVTAPLALQSISSTPTTVKAGEQVTLTVTLNATTATNKNVTLVSSNPTLFPVPSVVTVAAGNSTKTFKVTTKGTAADTNVTWSATFAGATLVSDPVAIQRGTLVGFTLSSTNVIGGTGVTGTVTVDGVAPVGGFTVSLVSGGPTVVGVPASVIIPEGAKSVDFAITTQPVSVIKGYGITAKLNSVIQKPTLKVRPPQILALSAPTPNPVKGGSSAMATVSISGPAPAGGFVINVASDKAEATVPATVTVPAGATSVNFTIATTAVAAKVSAKITVSKTLSASKIRTLIINP